MQLKDQLLCLETEQESILGVIGKEIDAACKTFSRDSIEKLKVIMSSYCAFQLLCLSVSFLIYNYNKILMHSYMVVTFLFWKVL